MGETERARERPLDARAVEYALLGEWLRGHRERAGLGLREVAKAMGKNVSFVYRVETGRQRIDVVHFVQLAGLIGVSESLTLKAIRETLSGASDA